MLVERFFDVSVKTKEDVFPVATEYDNDGPIPFSRRDPFVGHVRTRQPAGSLNELTSLADVFADPRNITVISFMHQRPENTREVDKTRNDPWCDDFQKSFNADEFRPDVPDAFDGVTSDNLEAMDPNDHSHYWKGEALKREWTWFLGLYTVCHSNYSKSGQGEHVLFPTFTDGQPILCYIPCVFKYSPSLDIILRPVSGDQKAESGVGRSSIADCTSPGASTERPMPHVKRRLHLKDGVSKLAESLAGPSKFIQI